MMNKYKNCKYCGDPVVAPHDLGHHLACLALAANENNLELNLELDVKDISLAPKTK